jgi:hypothetical protein
VTSALPIYHLTELLESLGNFHHRSTRSQHHQRILPPSDELLEPRTNHNFKKLGTSQQVGVLEIGKNFLTSEILALAEQGLWPFPR